MQYHYLGSGIFIRPTVFRMMTWFATFLFLFDQCGTMWYILDLFMESRASLVKSYRLRGTYFFLLTQTTWRTGYVYNSRETTLQWTQCLRHSIHTIEPIYLAGTLLMSIDPDHLQRRGTLLGKLGCLERHSNFSIEPDNLKRRGSSIILRPTQIAW